MKSILKFNGVMAACAAATMLTMGSARAELDTVKFEVIVGNHTDGFTINYQTPFFRDWLPERSGGKITSHVVPYTEVGLSGFEIMKLLKLGTNDISWSVPGYMAGESPIVEGIELPGITGDAQVMYKVQDAYRSLIDRELREKFNSRLIFYSQQPALQAFCKLTEDEIANFSLDTMKGKKARVHSTSFADFVESFGGVPVTMPFADVVPALERGVLDCALTSPSSAYGFKFGQVTNTVVEIRSGYTTFIFAMNLDTWNKLNDETKKFLDEQFAKVEAEMRDYQPQVQQEVAACLAEGPCPLGEPAKMKYVKLSDADEARLRKGVEESVLPRWAERAGPVAAEEWNSAVSGILGMSIKTK